uniref:Uncharacterized protein n=1 Tax=Myoviridae sp. ctfrL10 TaxID=2826678 RepID=A0A8S5MRU3_9CAUD|nr:MAG TPA: hypothetical protein [Myoviridae sp. ctfrL10]
MNIPRNGKLPSVWLLSSPLATSALAMTWTRLSPLEVRSVIPSSFRSSSTSPSTKCSTAYLSRWAMSAIKSYTMRRCNG